MWRSSSVPITPKDSLSSRSGGSSNERSHGLGGAGVSPKIGRISIEKRSHFCASLQSDSCSENYAIQHDLSGQTLSLESVTPYRWALTMMLQKYPPRMAKTLAKARRPPNLRLRLD